MNKKFGAKVVASVEAELEQKRRQENIRRDRSASRHGTRRFIRRFILTDPRPEWNATDSGFSMISKSRSIPFEISIDFSNRKRFEWRDVWVRRWCWLSEDTWVISPMPRLGSPGRTWGIHWEISVSRWVRRCLPCMMCWWSWDLICMRKNAWIGLTVFADWCLIPSG